VIGAEGGGLAVAENWEEVVGAMGGGGEEPALWRCGCRGLVQNWAEAEKGHFEAEIEETVAGFEFFQGEIIFRTI
jgi:hypothetical protein